MLSNGKNFEVKALWSGWSIRLPQSNSAYSDNGSWSAWGEDWAVDITIIEFSPPDLIPTESVNSSIAAGGLPIAGSGWTGAAETLIERDGDNDVFRLAGTLAAPGTLMSFWVSYFSSDQKDFANALISSASHVAAT